MSISYSAAYAVPPSHLCRLLWFGGEHRRFDALFTGMTLTEGVRRSSEDARTLLEVEGRGSVEVVPTFMFDDAVETLRSHYVNLLILDLRWSANMEQDVSRARRLLEYLDRGEDIELRYGFHRILVLLSGEDAYRIDSLLLELGALGVRHVLRDVRPDGDYTITRDAHSDAFSTRVLHQALSLVGQRRTGKTAICASGGGITGIFFELGALKCIEDCLGGRPINEFDMLFGISAGAVITSLLAVGYRIQDIMAAVAGVPGYAIEPLDLSLLNPRHLNVLDASWRVGTAARSTASWAWRAVRGQSLSEEEQFRETTGMIGAPFQSYQFERMLRSLLLARGGHNDFSLLQRPLYIGATDQDERRHVLFGDENHRDVPISKAVQASLSINPAFTAVKIGDRYYEDGAITRTSDFQEAIQRDATLIFILDPFVPYVSPHPGLAHRRGLLYNIDQNIRTISYTRFENTRDSELRKYPDVSTYTFLPSNRQRWLLSRNPMDHRPWLPIWKAAYLSTLQRFRQLRHRLAGDLREHHWHLDLAPAQQVADRLERSAHLSFADFLL